MREIYLKLKLTFNMDEWELYNDVADETVVEDSGLLDGLKTGVSLEILKEKENKMTFIKEDEMKCNYCGHDMILLIVDGFVEIFQCLNCPSICIENIEIINEKEWYQKDVENDLLKLIESNKFTDDELKLYNDDYVIGYNDALDKIRDLIKQNRY
jgi:hypothetical protein